MVSDIYWVNESMNKRMEPPHMSSEKALEWEPSLYMEETVVFSCTCELPKVTK